MLKYNRDINTLSYYMPITCLLHALEHRVEENTAQLNFLAENMHQIMQNSAHQEKKAQRQGILLDVISSKYMEQQGQIFELRKEVYLAK